MKLMLLINMSVIALLAVAASALTAGSVGSEESRKSPDLGDTFRSDTTLRFMRRIQPQQKGNIIVDQKPVQHLESPQQQAEAARSKLCVQYGFKAAERAGCVAFMRQACHDGARAAHKDVALESCVHFFQEEQPGFDSKTKLAKKSDQQAPLGDLKDWQQGPQYNSKRAQKASDKVAEDQKDKPKAAPLSPAWVNDKIDKDVDALAKSDDPLSDMVDGAADAAQDAHEGGKKKAPKQQEEAEEKEVPSVPGCKNSPKGWEDANGKDCEDYAEGEWCTRHGGYGDAWLDDWGTFEDVANKGKSAKQACCVCGGGYRKDEAASPEDKSADKPEKEAAGAPAGAPVPAITGPILGSKKSRALQSQGYSGDLVAHEDQKTMTEDWGMEFGPRAGHRNIKAICDEHPDNEWCLLHGYYDKERSAASLKSMAAVLIALLFACLR